MTFYHVYLETNSYGVAERERERGENCSAKYSQLPGDVENKKAGY